MLLFGKLALSVMSIMLYSSLQKPQFELELLTQ